MRIEKISLDKLSSRALDIGYVGEKDHVKVVIQCAGFFKDYPDATAAMACRPPVGDAYPVELTKSGVDLEWAVSESDIAAAGNGAFQITFTQDGEIVKSAFGSYTVRSSLVGNGEPPEPLDDWIQEAQELLAEVEDLTVEVSGETPSITGEAGKTYICGTLTSLTITPPESGMMNVMFTSGSTATTLTATGVTFPDWFEVEANTKYEISILDGMGVVAAWETT